MDSYAGIMSWNDVDLRHLHALRAVAEEGSFGRAADRLGYTQSAVSQQIAALERAVGMAVFDRPGGPKPVELTSAGRLLLRHADHILEHMEAAEADLEGHRNGISGSLIVGVYQSVSVKVLPAVAGRMRRERPDVDIRPFEEHDDSHMLERLATGDLDLTFTVAPVHDARFEVIELCEDPFVLVTPKSEGPRRPVAIAQLSKTPLIGQQPNDACQTRIESGLARAGVRPNFVFRSNDNGAVQAMVRAGMGHAVMPVLAVDFNDPGIEIHELDPPIPPRMIALAMRAGRTRSPAVEHFVRLAIEVCGELPNSVPQPAA